MAKQEKGKVCFIIAPIGDEGSDVRRRSDQVLKHIITPAAKECDYEPIRADKISEPGMITSQVIQHLLDDLLVIADLTGRNPNVFYELAIRHAIRKPVVQIIQRGEPIPFDVAQSRTIQVDHHDLDSIARCREELVGQIRSVEKDPSDVDTPISVAVDLQSLCKSENPLEKSNAEIMALLQDLRSKIAESSEMSMRPRIHPRMAEEVLLTFDRLSDILELPSGGKLSTANREEAGLLLHRAERALYHLMAESGLPPGMVEEMMGRRLKRRHSE